MTTRGITINPIGSIHTPQHVHADLPIPGRFKSGVKGWVELDPEYWERLQDLAGFSHALLLYRLYHSDRVI